MEEDDFFDESLAVIYSLLPNVEITIYDKEKEQILGSSAANIDVLDAIMIEAKRLTAKFKGEEIRIFETSDGICFRAGVKKVGVVPLFTRTLKEHLLLVEYYSGTMAISLDRFQDLFDTLTLSIRFMCSQNYSQKRLGYDCVTELPTRDALIEQLTKVAAKNDNESLNACLAIISISNATDLNRTLGIRYVDDIIRGFGRELRHIMPGQVFRIGGTKFGMIVPGDIYYSVPVVESVLDRVLQLDDHVVTASVVAEIEHDIYHTVYTCESHLKNAQEDVVSVVRRPVEPGMAKEYQEVNDTYFVKNCRCVAEPEEKEEDIVKPKSHYGNVDEHVYGDDSLLQPASDDTGSENNQDIERYAGTENDTFEKSFSINPDDASKLWECANIEPPEEEDIPAANFQDDFQDVSDQAPEDMVEKSENDNVFGFMTNFEQ